MFLRKQLRSKMRRFGRLVVAVAFLLQVFSAASMPAVRLSADADMIVICTSTGMKAVPLAQVLGIQTEQNQTAPDDTASGGLCAACLLVYHAVAVTPSSNVLCAIGCNAHVLQAIPVDAPVLNVFRRVQQARAPPPNV